MDISVGSQLCLQQTASGTGVFNGSTFGFARTTIAATGSIEVRFQEPGTVGNAYKIRLIDPGSELTACHARYDETSKLLSVWLKHNGAAITATASEVASTIEALRARTPYRAAAASAGVMTATAEITLANGLEPVLRNGRFEFSADNTNCGKFFFGSGPLVVHTIEGDFSGGATVTVTKANLDAGLAVISGSEVQLYSAALNAGNNFSLNGPFQLGKGQALLVACPAVQGTVRVHANRLDMLR